MSNWSWRDLTKWTQLHFSKKVLWRCPYSHPLHPPPRKGSENIFYFVSLRLPKLSKTDGWSAVSLFKEPLLYPKIRRGGTWTRSPRRQIQAPCFKLSPFCGFPLNTVDFTQDQNGPFEDSESEVGSVAPGKKAQLLGHQNYIQHFPPKKPSTVGGWSFQIHVIIEGERSQRLFWGVMKPPARYVEVFIWPTSDIRHIDTRKHVLRWRVHLGCRVSGLSKMIKAYGFFVLEGLKTLKPVSSLHFDIVQDFRSLCCYLTWDFRVCKEVCLEDCRVHLRTCPLFWGKYLS